MKQYTSTEVEEFVITHLYYSMGADRMVYYDYETLIIPQLRKKIKRIVIQEKMDDLILYTAGDIDTIVRVIKETYQLFGHYNGDEVLDLNEGGE